MFWTFIATFGYAGKLKPAPGTWGTLASLPLVYFLSRGGPIIYMVATLLLFMLGVVAAQVYEASSGQHDSGEIVIDEVVGFLITMTWLPATWQAYLAAFCLFRVLDIWKPFPIGYLDKRVPGGMGVMADDVVAGIIGNIILQMVYTKTMWLGVQLQ